MQRERGPSGPPAPGSPEAELGLGIAGSVDLGGILAGKGALTAPLDQLVKAQKAEARGWKPETIWRKHGWFKSPDGQWRFEIDDSTAGFAKPFEKYDPESAISFAPPGNAQMVFNHPELYSAYPEAGKIVANQIAMEPGTSLRGSYSSRVPQTKDYFGVDPEITLSGGSKEELRGGMLHELQHSIQAETWSPATPQLVRGRRRPRGRGRGSWATTIA